MFNIFKIPLCLENHGEMFQVFVIKYSLNIKTKYQNC